MHPCTYRSRLYIISTRCLSPCSTRWLNHSKMQFMCVWDPGFARKYDNWYKCQLYQIDVLHNAKGKKWNFNFVGNGSGIRHTYCLCSELDPAGILSLRFCYLYIFTGFKRSVDRLGTLGWASTPNLPHGIFRIRHGRQFIGDFPYAVPVRQGLAVLFRLDTPAHLWLISSYIMAIYAAPNHFPNIDFYWG